MTERLERVSRNVGTLGAQVGLVVARGKAQSARNRRRTNRMVAKASRALDQFAKARPLTGAQRAGPFEALKRQSTTWNAPYDLPPRFSTCDYRSDDSPQTVGRNA